LALNKALDRMERAITQLRDFTADVAHELRTPLMVMTLTIDRLPDVPERTALRKDARGMSQLVTQLLDFAHADSLVVPNTMTADLRMISMEVVTQLTPVALEAGKEFHFNDYGTAMINGHPDAISRALRNIVENALKFAPADTVIDVSCGPGAILSVRDRGPGFPDSEPQKLLERFHRGQNPGGAGMGLGLNIVQSIMRAHRGAVDLQNAPNGGALVTLRFGVFTQ
jgi:signal transduction histidine kinase